jgi:hypothetical protein
VNRRGSYPGAPVPPVNELYKVLYCFVGRPWASCRMAKTKMKAYSTSVRDPIGMSQYERESLAAEAVLAAKRKRKRRLRKNLNPKLLL